MDKLRLACEQLQQLIEEQKKFKEEKLAIREKCDKRIKEEMNNFCLEMFEILEYAKMLINNFSHYGDSIKFSISLSDDENDVLIVNFTREHFDITKNADNEILYSSKDDLDSHTVPAYEYIVVNKSNILISIKQKITVYIENETNTINIDMSNESKYYDNLCSKLSVY